MRRTHLTAAFAAGLALVAAPLIAAAPAEADAGTTTPDSISVSASATPTHPAVGGTIDLSATAAGGVGALSYHWSGPGGFTAAGGSATVSDATAASSGTYTVTVSDEGASTANASADVTVSVTAEQVPTKTIVIVPEQGTVGKPVTLSATVSTLPPGRAEVVGLVQFTAEDGPDGPWPLGIGQVIKGQAQFTYTPKSAGTYTIVANYVPDNDDSGGSESIPRDMNVAPAVSEGPVTAVNPPGAPAADSAQEPAARELAATGSAVMVSMGFGGIAMMSGLVLLLLSARRRIRRS